MELGYSRELKSYLKSFRGTILKLLTKENLLGKPPPYNLLNMDAYSKNFQKPFLAKNPCDCNQIRSNKIVASVTALNHFHF